MRPTIGGPPTGSTAAATNGPVLRALPPVAASPGGNLSRYPSTPVDGGSGGRSALGGRTTSGDDLLPAGAPPMVSPSSLSSSLAGMRRGQTGVSGWAGGVPMVDTIEGQAIIAHETKAQAEDRALLSQLVEAKQLSPALKAIYDRGWQTSFSHLLSTTVELKDAKIKQICHDHHEEFIGAIDSLLTMKLDIHELKDHIEKLNKQVQDSGSEAIKKAKILMTQRYIRRNINEALEVLRACKFVTSLASKAIEQIDSKKYFSALKTLEQLRRQHLPRFADYDFAKHLEEKIPEMYMRIKDNVKGEFTAWLSTIKERSRVLGELAMQQTEEQLRIDEEKEKVRRHKTRGSMASMDMTTPNNAASPTSARSPTKSDSKDELKDSGGPKSSRGHRRGSAALEQKQKKMELQPDEDVLKEEEWDEEGLFEKALVNLAPVYQCLHMYENLDVAHQFQSLYKDKRRNQAQQIVDQMERLQLVEFMTNAKMYFANLAGFFLIEDAVMKSGNELMSRSEVETMWDRAVTKVTLILQEQTGYVRDPATFLTMKYQLMLFAKTLDSHGIFVTPLIDFLAQSRDKFEVVLMRALHDDVVKIFTAEKYEPLRIKDYSDYQRDVEAFELQGEAMHVDFPTNMPFSSTVPSICRLLQHFIVDYCSYAHYVADMEGFVFKAVDTALSKEVNATLNNIIDGLAPGEAKGGTKAGHAPVIRISQAVQFSINAQYFAESACGFLERFIVSCSDSKATSHESQFGARKHFAQTRVRCEDLLFELVDSKIDSFMSLGSNINWLPSVCQTAANDFIGDLIVYLETTFASLVFLPDPIREAVHFTSCKHISVLLMNLLLGDQTKKINIVAIWNLNFDVLALEQFAYRCPIPNLAETFAEIRQLLNLFLSGDVEAILDPDKRAASYSYLSPARLRKVLDKYKDLGVFSSLPAGLPKLKRKQIDSVLKKLK